MIGACRWACIEPAATPARSRRSPTTKASFCRAAGKTTPAAWDRRFRQLRSPEGERLVLDENMFVEVALPSGIMRRLSDEEMEAYRGPYRDRDRRLPTLVWP